MTSFWAISLYAVLSGLSGIAIGRWLLPSDRALDRAWDDGWDAGRRVRQRDIDEAADSAYRHGRRHAAVIDATGPGSNAYCYWEDDDGQPAEEAPQDPQPRAEEDDLRGVASPDDQEGRAVGTEEHAADDVQSPGMRSAGRSLPASEGLDWADELSGMSVQIAVEDATETLAAVQPPPAPGTFEYYASDWQSRFDHWLAGQTAELTATRQKLGIS